MERALLVNGEEGIMQIDIVHKDIKARVEVEDGGKVMIGWTQGWDYGGGIGINTLYPNHSKSKIVMIDLPLSPFILETVNVY
jgi:hypothetical protein